MHTLFRRIILLVILHSLSHCVLAASFDCGRTRNATEKTICIDVQLSALDDELARAYAMQKTVTQNFGELRAEQKHWLQRRNDCVDRNCLLRVYRERIDALQYSAKTTKSTATREPAVCDEIRGIFLSGTYRKYVVDFRNVEDESHRIYDLHSGSAYFGATLEAFCGYGTGSLCEMNLQIKNRKTFHFTLPVNMRVLQIKKRVYIVNGVAIDTARKIETKDFAVNELHPDRLQLVCTKF